MIEKKELEEEHIFNLSLNSSLPNDSQVGFNKFQEKDKDTSSHSSSVISFNPFNPNQSFSKMLDQATQNVASTKRYYSDLSDAVIEINEEIGYSNYEDISDGNYRESGDSMQVDTFFKEIKEDMRERETRNEKRISDLADHTEKRDAQLRADLKEREERFRQESREREERFLNAVDEIKSEFRETKADNKSTKIALWTLSITTIIGIAAMVVAILIAL